MQTTNQGERITSSKSSESLNEESWIGSSPPSLSTASSICYSSIRGAMIGDNMMQCRSDEEREENEEPHQGKCPNLRCDVVLSQTSS